MRTVYIADDGTEFDNRFDCKDYEWKLNHPNLNEVNFYDENNNELGDIFSKETYGNTIRIVVPNDNALKDLQALGEYTGFCCYEFITERGEWVWDYKSKFVKKE